MRALHYRAIRLTNRRDPFEPGRLAEICLAGHPPAESSPCGFLGVDGLSQLVTGDVTLHTFMLLTNERLKY